VSPLEQSPVWESHQSSSKLTRRNRSDNISPRVEEMIKDYTEFPFPSELAGFGFSLAIYVRNY
jgi:hypothetical protein